MALALTAVAFLATYFVHSTILLGGGWALSAAGVVRSPHARDTLWKVCLVGGLLTATAQALSPYQPLAFSFRLPKAARAAQIEARAPGAGSLSAAAAPSRSEAAVRAPAWSEAASRAPASPSRTVAGAANSRAAASLVSTPYTPHPAPSRSSTPIWAAVVLGAWLLIAVGLLARLAVRRRRFCRRLASRRSLAGGAVVETLEALRAEAGIRRPIRLRVSADLAGPVAMGSSEICLPERALTSLSPAEQRAVLAHELGHLVRRDPAWLSLAVVIENVFCFQPLNRLARRRGQEAAELICDDWAVSYTGASLTLAKCLAEVASWMQGVSRPVPVAGMAENGSQLVRRVERLLAGGEPRAMRGVRVAVPVALLVLSTVAFAAPDVEPPCMAAPAPARQAAAVVAAAAPADTGGSRTWATVRDDRLITFSRGFAPRISGEGRIGLRRGGRAVELVDGQCFEVNGRMVDGGTDVAVRDTDTLHITDGHGRVEWTLTPVRLTEAQAEAWAEPLPDDTGDALAAADVDELGSDLADLGPRVAERVSRELTLAAPEIARLRDENVRAALRVAAEVAPRAARLGAEISTQVVREIGPALERAFRDAGWSDDSTAGGAPGPKRR